jgi:hypothetical protein
MKKGVMSLENLITIFIWIVLFLLVSGGLVLLARYLGIIG